VRDFFCTQKAQKTQKYLSKTQIQSVKICEKSQFLFEAIDLKLFLNQNFEQ